MEAFGYTAICLIIIIIIFYWDAKNLHDPSNTCLISFVTKCILANLICTQEKVRFTIF